MVSTASMGHQAKLAIKTETTYGTLAVPDTQLIFASESVGKTAAIIERQGIRGTRSHVADDARQGPYTVSGTIVLEPTPADWVVLLPLIMGGSASGTSYPLAETLKSFSLLVDRVADRWCYVGCVVTRATISGTKGGLVRLSLEIVGQKEGKIVSSAFVEGAAGTADAFPSLTPSVAPPFMFNGDFSLTLVSVASRETESFELVIDNAVVADRFMNSLTIINAPAGDRMVTLTTSHPYASGYTDLYEQALAGSAGTLALTTYPTSLGTYSLTFTFGTLQVPSRSPVVQDKSEIMLNLNMVARKTGSTPELATVLDSTG